MSRATWLLAPAPAPEEGTAQQRDCTQGGNAEASHHGEPGLFPAPSIVNNILGYLRGRGNPGKGMTGGTVA